MKEKYLITVESCGCIEVERNDKGPISGFAMAAIAHIMLEEIERKQLTKDPSIQTVLIALKKAVRDAATPHSGHDNGGPVN